MKKILIPSLLISVALICSCQKQDSTAEQQLAPRKAEPDAREQEFDERLKALNERVSELDQRLNALTRRETATTNFQPSSPPVQAQLPDPAQLRDESDRRIQEAAAEAQMADVPGLDPEKAEKDRLTREQLAQRQQDMKASRQRKLEILQNSRMQGAAGSSAAETTSPSASPTPQ